jgi:hypothetical protein
MPGQLKNMVTHRKYFLGKMKIGSLTCSGMPGEIAQQVVLKLISGILLLIININLNLSKLSARC